MESHHHWAWMAVVLIIFGCAIYIWRPNNYEKGSIHQEMHREDLPLSIHIGEGGCATLPKNTTTVKSSVKH